jgi:hypothetical protein
MTTMTSPWDSMKGPMRRFINCLGPRLRLLFFFFFLTSNLFFLGSKTRTMWWEWERRVIVVEPPSPLPGRTGPSHLEVVYFFLFILYFTNCYCLLHATTKRHESLDYVPHTITIAGWYEGNENDDEPPSPRTNGGSGRDASRVSGRIFILFKSLFH